MPGVMKLKRAKVGGRYVAWMRGAFCGGQGLLGAPEVAGRPCSQPQAEGRDTGRTRATSARYPALARAAARL